MISPDTSPAAATVLRFIESLGYSVSVFHNDGSLLGTVSPFVEIHAIDTSTDPVQSFIARTFTAEHADADYACTLRLAELIGIDLLD